MLHYEAVDARGDRPHDLVGAVEVKVAETHESPNCQVLPAEVRLPGAHVGSLIWGGLSPALNVDLVRWRRVTRVLG